MMPMFWPFRRAPSPSYQSISAKSPSDTEYSSTSDPDVGSSLPCQTYSRTQQPLFFTIGFWLLLFICFFETSIIAFHSSIFISKAISANNPLTKTPVPEIPQILKTFDSDPSLMGLQTTQDVEDAWSSFNLPNGGFIHLPNPQAYSLLPNINVIPGIGNVYMLSSFHQLHCLKKLHLAFIGMQNISTSTQSMEEGVEGEVEMSFKHAEHCFAYLKQGIMCAGDMSLEGPDEGGKGTLRGWGVVHQCRSWDGVEAWRREHGIV